MLTLGNAVHSVIVTSIEPSLEAESEGGPQVLHEESEQAEDEVDEIEEDEDEVDEIEEEVEEEAEDTLDEVDVAVAAVTEVLRGGGMVVIGFRTPFRFSGFIEIEKSAMSAPITAMKIRSCF